ncbi:two-component regulator propeller domain-containing protein [Chitinophaga sp. GbtcB8]|uniref:hybrid sensor histidine kinase/response regulator n=1 Tax=Chitinophaga sp. GbtcB8 TaxID=2824753 RepID=UPI001C2F7AAD|nr:two-component regulator propeller domain-containing protein [Chitinophaga sp. GbtcB8]
MKKAVHRILYTLFAFLYFHAAYAGPYPAINHLGIEQGLSNNTVRCIFQDHNGFIWFGTYDGLNRYDGYGFKVFRNKLSDTNSLVNNIITAIAEDQHHFLWIGTRQGVSCYNPLLSRFTSITYGPSSQKLNTVIRSIGIDKQDHVFIGTEGLGLLLSGQGASSCSSIPLILNGTETHKYGVHAILTDAGNRVWVMVQNQGLALYNAATQKLNLVNTLLPGATCLATDGKTIWVGAGTAVYAYNVVSRELNKIFDGINDPLEPGLVLSLMLTKDKQQLWISTETGNICTWNIYSGEVGHIKAGEGRDELSGGAIHTMYEDGASRKWIGTLRGGINIIDPQKSRFQTIRRERGSNNTMTGNVVAAFYETRDSSLWIGTDGYGLNKWNRHTNTFTAYVHNPANPHSLSDNFITCLEGDAQQHLWIGTYTKGIQQFDNTTQQFKHYPCINPVSHAENKVVFVLYTDKDKQLWASTLRSGGVYGALYRYNTAKDAFDMFDDRLSDLFCLKEDANGDLWGGNLNQLIKIDKVNRQHAFYTIGHTVRAIYDDGSNQLWVGTEGGGLFLFDKRTHTITARYTTENGLCNDAVLNMLDDGSGNLWISTYNGLSRFNRAARSFTNYYQGDGLQSNQFFYNAARQLRSGEMAFGGIKGFSLFYPGQIKSQDNQLKLVLTDVAVNNAPLQKNEAFITAISPEAIAAVKVPYNKAVFSFAFTALEFSSPNKITYSYYMEGWDKGWNNAGNMRTATYTHLNEGKYTFRVRCTNAEGVMNKQEIALVITVLPPWYRSWWAWLLYTLLLTGSVYLYFLYKMRQNRLKYEVRLAHVNAQKERDLHEKKLSFFTHISHEFRTPLTLIINPVKEMLTAGTGGQEQEELNTVYRNARRLLSLVDQLLLFRKADSEADQLKIVQLDFGHICKEVYLCFVHQAKIKKIDYRFECPDTPLPMYVDREKIEIVLFNLLSNALKFTSTGGAVTFSITELNDSVQVSVTDTGCGIAPETGDQLFRKFYQVKNAAAPSAKGFGIGLYLVKHFVDRHGGRVSYESKEGEGTRFQLVLLKGQTHLGHETIFQDVPENSIFLRELAADTIPEKPGTDLPVLVTEQQTILVIDDDEELRKYVAQLFADGFTILEAASGEEGLKMATDYLPDVIISDITMREMSGIDVCRSIKSTPALSHIPVILLTATTTSESQLKGIESGADDYITKPFEKELLKARVQGTLRKRNTLQQYFYNEITLKRNDLKVSVEYKEFLDRCIKIVESHLDDDNFSIRTLAREMGMSHSGLYKKVKSVSGQSISGFIRFIRLRKAAEFMINTENNITEIASMAGFNNIKYFRQYFNELFGMNPSEYIKKFRKPFHNTHHVNFKQG